ncbi:LysR family transcriptional regulator [Bradyrhizobium genosp. L]|uniref:LysR family transcriptional regulator n=1 Tax=Bradyrhizobium genosp. L TaxID=83637 RepID=UPI0018A29E91|nr:LysR family transcriptional regulator [Bradyrhizobium genosp. L]QPF86869.1 LysR family transcriptional regulator [Bradyrhizobium genosp. L]
MDINLRQIRSFIAVAKLGSFTRAAEFLHISQPTLTVQIRRLEEALQLRLFDRNPRHVDLTRIGRDLLPAFERTIEDLDSVLAELKNVSTARLGVVRIAALPSFASGLLPDVIRRFRKQNPGASFAVKDIIANPLLDLIRSNDVDLGLTGGDVDFPDIEVLFRTSDEMHVVYLEGHPIGKFSRITAERLAQFPIVMMDTKTSVRAVTDTAFGKAKLRPTPISEVTHMMTAVGMVRAGIGITLLPSSALEITAESGLISRRINDPNFIRPISLIKKRNRTLPPLSKAFSDYLARSHSSVLARNNTADR